MCSIQSCKHIRSLVCMYSSQNQMTECGLPEAYGIHHLLPVSFSFAFSARPFRPLLSLLKLSCRVFWLSSRFAAISSCVGLWMFPPPPKLDQTMFKTQIPAILPRPVWRSPSGRVMAATSTSCAIRAVSGSVFSTIFPVPPRPVV